MCDDLTRLPIRETSKVISAIIAGRNVARARLVGASLKNADHSVSATVGAEHLDQNSPTFKLMPTLVLSIGILVLLSVGSVLIVNWIVDRRIVQEFTSRLITRVLSAEERSLREHLDAAIDQGDFIAIAISSGRYQAAEPALADFVSGTLAAAPQVDGVILSDGNGKALRVVRGASNTEFQIDHFNVAGDSQFAAFADQIRTRKHPYWGAPLYREQRQETFLNYRVPIWSGDTYLGFAAIGISTRALSTLAKELSDPPRSVSFMLYGQDRVLAHPLMTEGSPRQLESASFPLLRTFGDPIIENLDALPPVDEIGLAPPAGVIARESSAQGERYFVFAREITDYSELPITVGTYFLKRAVDGPIRLFYWATILAVALLGVSLIVAALMAGAIARPIRRAARGATAIGSLDFDEVAPLPSSYFREINSLARSFNAMLDGLRAFGRYVPRTLVMRLVKEGRVGSGTEERVLAIMFTDIVSFTSTCEKMSAAEVAEFINQHLSLVSFCVEQEGGTIDKFIGDAVMAFWGAPGRIENPAASACRTAVAIQRVLAADNKRRVADGLEPVRMRIGIHLGSVVVGDIGTPNRINYTIVGDAVNATQRLETLGKTIDPDAEAIALVSEEIFAAVPAGFQFIERGIHLVKGKQESLRVFQLIGGPEEGASRTTTSDRPGGA
jgi:adenylate cyclase